MRICSISWFLIFLTVMSPVTSWFLLLRLSSTHTILPCYTKKWSEEWNKNILINLKAQRQVTLWRRNNKIFKDCGRTLSSNAQKVSQFFDIFLWHFVCNIILFCAQFNSYFHFNFSTAGYDRMTSRACAARARLYFTITIYKIGLFWWELHHHEE